MAMLPLEVAAAAGAAAAWGAGAADTAAAGDATDADASVSIRAISNDSATVAFNYFNDDALRRCGQLQHHFIGFDINEVFIAGDGLAYFFVPLQ
jgi:hypothetical protein